MTSNKNTKKALLMSALSLLLCVSMLVGTTFAWFTDTVESGQNIIAAGNLDVELTHANDTNKGGDPEKVSGATDLFEDVTLWEPGAVAYENFTVSNVGTLDLKYMFALNVTDENAVVTNGKAYSLSQVLKVAVVENGVNTSESRENIIANIAEEKWQSLATFSLSGNLYDSADVQERPSVKTYGIVIYWEPSPDDNNWNVNNGKKVSDYDKTGKNELRIELNIKLEATQLVSESDSFGPDYDKEASWMGSVDTNWYNNSDTEFVIDTAEELAGLAQIVNSGTDTFDGKTVKLGADIDLNDIPWTPIGNNDDGWNNKFNGSFIGTDYTISNLYVTGTTGLGLFGYVGNTAHIEGVTIDGAYVSGNDYVGAVVGTGYLASDCLKNCTVKNAEIIATPYLTAEGIYDGGAKAGAVAGFVSNGKVIGNRAENCTVTAYRDLGGIVGMVQGENNTVEVSGNSVDGITLEYFNLNDAAYDGDTPNQNMGNIVGRTNNANIDKNSNTANNVTREVVITYTKDGIQYIKDIDANKVTLFKVNKDYESTIVEVPEGVTAIGNYAFASNSNVKEVILASTVRDLGRGFDSSTVEKVVLNEGLTTISSRAFKSTTNLKEVVISSTVTAIADNAFQKSGIKNITIPANVKTIGETAFGASLVETVTIEGDIDIEGYAFRGCTKLHTVYLNGLNVNFVKSTLNGRNSMWFCNGESNNPNTSNIDFYVKNDVIKERVLTAMGAERNNTDVYCEQTAVTDEETTYYVDSEGNAIIYEAEGLIAALEDGKDVVLADTVTVPSADAGSNAYGATGINVKNGQNFDGNGNSFGLDKWGTWDSAISTTGGVIKNVTINKGMRGIFVNHNSTDSSQVVLENVIIDGTVYTISCDQGTNQGLKATNCTFNGWTSYAATIGNVEFINCSFGEGQGYKFCRPYAPTAFVNCDFTEGYEIDARVAVTFENCTINGIALTAENLSTLVTSNVANATVK